MKAEKKSYTLSWYWSRILVYHVYYRRSGLYRFILLNLFKLLGFFAIILLAFYLLERYIIDFSEVLPVIFDKMPKLWVFLSFFVSESIIGLIPPDFLVLWAEGFDNSFTILLILALISYAGGVMAYILGVLIRRFKKVRSYVDRKYVNQAKQIKKWGGAVIIIAALFPLPWGVVCTLSGLLKFPIRSFLIFGTLRLFRFHLYSIILFRLM